MAFYFAALIAAESAAVIVTGTGVPTAVIAKAQVESEARMAGSGLTVVPAIELAKVIGSTSPSQDTAPRAEAQGLVEAAKKLVYDGANQEALTALTKAAEIQDKAPAIPAGDRVHTALWRATVHLAMNDEPGARSAAQDAVRLDPKHVVSLDEFAPDLAQLVEAAREPIAATAVPVTFTGFPDAADVLLDDRDVVGRRSSAPAGKHWVRVRAKGMTELAWPVQIAAPAATIEARPMAIAISPAAATRLGTPEGLGESARALGIGSLASIHITRDEIRVRGWSGGAALPSKIYKTNELGAAQAYAARSMTVGATPTPIAVSTSPRAGTTTAMRASAGPRLAFLTRTLSADGLSRVGLRLTGTGGAVDARWSRNSLRAAGEAWVVSFAPTTATADLGTVRAHAPGGTVFGARAMGGVATFGGVTLGLGASFERYQATMLPVEERIPLFVSQTRIAPEVRIGYSISIVEAGIGIAPMAVVRESPAGTTGDSPRGGLGLDWRVGTSLPAWDRWRLGLRYDGSMQSTTFEGPSDAAFDPAVEDATVRDVSHAFTVQAVGRF